MRRDRYVAVFRVIVAVRCAFHLKIALYCAEQKPSNFVDPELLLSKFVTSFDWYPNMVRDFFHFTHVQFRSNATEWPIEDVARYDGPEAQLDSTVAVGQQICGRVRSSIRRGNTH